MLKKHLCSTGIKIVIPLPNDMAISSKMGQGIRNACEYSKKVVLIILFWNVLETAIASKGTEMSWREVALQGLNN